MIRAMLYINLSVCRSLDNGAIIDGSSKRHIHPTQRIKNRTWSGSVCNSSADIPDVRINDVKVVQHERDLSQCTPRIQ
jgi:hypothetical protein